jgi:ribosomal protein L33
MAGRMRMYTSGWPKSQKRCCHSTGSPPRLALKKFDPKLRSK